MESLLRLGSLGKLSKDTPEKELSALGARGAERALKRRVKCSLFGLDNLCAINGGLNRGRNKYYSVVLCNSTGRCLISMGLWP